MSKRDVLKFQKLNVRERMRTVEDWLSWQEEDMSFGLRSIDDAVKLYEYGLLHSRKREEMADGWHPASFRAAIGYNPFDQTSLSPKEPTP